MYLYIYTCFYAFVQEHIYPLSPPLPLYTHIWKIKTQCVQIQMKTHMQSSCFVYRLARISPFKNDCFSDVLHRQILHYQWGKHNGRKHWNNGSGQYVFPTNNGTVLHPTCHARLPISLEQLPVSPPCRFEFILCPTPPRI